MGLERAEVRKIPALFVPALFLSLLGGCTKKAPLADLTRPPSQASPLVRDERAKGMPPLVFAGLSGLPPRFIDQGPNQGTGWIEYATRNLVRGLQIAGIEVKREYWTPARIAHEFRVGNPICTYPHEWNNPKRTFAQKPDRLYSIAFDYETESSRAIIFNKSDDEKFKRHLDAKGDLKVDALLEDPTLKLVLVRDKDYGRFTRKLTEINSAGDQVVRKQYQTHIYLQMVHDNRQLIEMLNAHRFDYILSDSIEDQDITEAGLDRERFRQINFHTSTFKSLDDPELTQVSVICSLHPLTLQALPVINQWIAVTRGAEQKRERLYYRRKIDSKYAKFVVQAASYTIAGRFASQLKDGSADTWYRLQQAYFPSLKLYPELREVGFNSTTKVVPTAADRAPKWHAIAEAGTLVILSESEFYHRSILDSVGEEYDVYAHTAHYPWDHRLLDQYLPPHIRDRLMTFDFSKERAGAASLREFNRIADFKGSPREVILFASGLKTEDLDSIFQALRADQLESFTAFDAAPSLGSKIASWLPEQLQSLNLTNCSLRQAGLEKKMGSLKTLKHLHLNSTQIARAEFGALIGRLPLGIESLSLGYIPQSWSLENIEIFKNRNWTHLKNLDLANNSMDDRFLNPNPVYGGARDLFGVLPITLERLDLGGNFFSPSAMRGIGATRFSRFKSLCVSPLDVAAPMIPLQLPQSLEAFETQLRPVDDTFLFPPQALRSLVLPWTQGIFQARGLHSFLTHLAPRVERLNLDNSGVNLETIRVLINRPGLQHIERLDLSNNNLSDEAIELLSQAKFTVNHFNIDNNLIGDRGAEIIAKRWLPVLKSLNLSFNPITEKGSRVLAQQLPPGLERLELGSIFGVDVGSLAQHLPKGLRTLNLSGNMITDPEMELLASKLPENLYDLNLARSAFSAKGAAILGPSLPRHLQTLDLRGVPFGSRGIELLAPYLPATLTELSLSDLVFNASAVEAIVKSMPPHLRVLDLEGIQWSDSSSALFLRSLPSSLQSLTLVGVPVGLEAARGLSRNWPEFLRNLTLEGAHLGDEGVQILSSSLPEALERLQLSGNQITDRGLEALVRRPMDQVTFLNLSNNSFTARGMRTLGSRKLNLKGLYLVSCGLNGAALDALGSNVLESLRRLHIGNNRFSNRSVLSLLKKLHPEFYKLYLTSVGLTFDGVKDLIRALPPKLTRLAIAGNDIGEKGFKLLDELVIERAKKGPRLELLKD